MPLVKLQLAIPSPAIRDSLKKVYLSVSDQVAISRNLRYRGPVHFGNNSHAFRVQIDAYSYVAHHSTVITSSIGRYCSVAHNVDMGMGFHVIDQPSTSSSMFNNRLFMYYSGDIPVPNPVFAENGGDTNEITVGNDVWIGAHTRFPKSVTIGHGAVIGTGTVVTKDIPPYAVVVGGGSSGSQRIVRYRFSDEIISDLMDIRWWDYDVPRMVASGIKVPRTKAEDFISFFKNEDREKLIPLSEPWLLVSIPNSDTAYIFPTEPDTFMDFNYVEVDDDGKAIRALFHIDKDLANMRDHMLKSLGEEQKKG